MQLKLIDHSSEVYEKMVWLRINVLLNPIGVPASFINKEKEKEDVLIGAFEGNELIGCCVLTKKGGYLLQLRQMAVATNFQGRGIGKEIVQYAEDVGKEKGYKKLMLHARDVVIPFYKSCGYEIAGEGFEEVSIPHHRMEKILV